jgi:hypothetical protein
MIGWIISQSVTFAATHLCSVGLAKISSAVCKTITIDASKDYIIINGKLTEINHRKCYQVAKGVIREIDPAETFMVV